MKQHLVRLQLRFEAPNAIASDSLKWQYIAIIATFSSEILFCSYSFDKESTYFSNSTLASGRLGPPDPLLGLDPTGGLPSLDPLTLDPLAKIFQHHPWLKHSISVSLETSGG